MFVYSTIPAAQESLTVATAMFTTNGTVNTVTDHQRWLAVAPNNAYLQAVYLVGRGAGLVAISGIMLRFMRLTTASTAGTAMTPRARDPRAPAAVTTPFSGPTIGSGGLATPLALGCGAAGPGGWVAPNPDSMIMLVVGASNGNGDFLSGSGTVSLAFDMSVEHQE